MSAAAARKARMDAPAEPSAATATTASRPELRVLPAPRLRAPRGPFVLAIGAVFTLGLLGVLLLNTVVNQDAFAVSALQQKATALDDQEQALTQAVAAADSPQRLEARARGLGMVPSVNPVFLRLADGKVLGDPVASKAARRSAAPAVAPPATGSTAAAGATGATPNLQATGAPVAGHPATSTAPAAPHALRTKAATKTATRAKSHTAAKGATAVRTKAAKAKAGR